MKNLIAYILVFIVAFFAVTGVLYYANTKYKNIFKFDFTPTVKPEEAVKKITLQIEDYQKVRNFIREKFYAEVIDSVKRMYWSSKTDTVFQVIVKDENLKSEIKETQKKNEELMKQLAAKEEELNKIKALQVSAKKDSTYNLWIKSTVKLYEAMDSKKAAQAMLGLQDNVARDLIYALKKKKAAEILSFMPVDKVTKLLGTR